MVFISDDFLVTKNITKRRYDSGRMELSKFSHQMTFLKLICRSNETLNFYPTDSKTSLPLLTLMTHKFPTAIIIENIQYHFPENHRVNNQCNY